MPRKKRHSTPPVNEVAPVFYRHVAKSGYKRRQWLPSDEWRLVLHDDVCPKLRGGACSCNGVDIRHVMSRTPGG